MTRRDKVLIRHRQAIKDAAARRNAVSIALVGSVARGDDKEGSDYDFLVEFDTGASLFDHGGLLMDLREILGREDVDVVDSDALTGRYRAMRKDAVVL